MSIRWRGAAIAALSASPPRSARLIGQLQARRLGIEPPDRPIGLLTHHLVTDGPTEAFVEHLIAVIGAHRAVRWAAVTELLR